MALKMVTSLRGRNDSFYADGVGEDFSDACKKYGEEFELGAVSPAKAKEEMDAVLTSIRNLDADIKRAPKVRDVFKKAWDNYYTDYLKFYKDNAEGTAAWLSRFMTSGGYKTAKKYECRTNEWRVTFEKEGGQATEPKHEKASSSKTGLIVGGIVVAGGLLYMLTRGHTAVSVGS